MTIKKSTFQNFLIICGVIIIGGVIFLAITAKPASTNEANNIATTTIEGDKQIINMTANLSGYQPAILEAKAGINTVLRVKSSNNYGCGSAFRIPKLAVSKNLPANGTTDIDLGVQASGTTLDATCSMGMYRMKIKFS
jgi:plastocyanin domain-containing protein